MEEPDEKFERSIESVSGDDISCLLVAREHYGDSWKRRGGVGAYMMLARKWDRLENAVRKSGWDVFASVRDDSRTIDGVIDDIRDLRRYLLLVESELKEKGLLSEDRHTP